MPYPEYRQRRPHFREPHPVRLPAVTLGAVASAVWYALFDLAGDGPAGYVRLSTLAVVLAAAAAGILALRGDRGVAVGVAIVSGFSLAAVMLVSTAYWLDGMWLLW